MPGLRLSEESGELLHDDSNINIILVNIIIITIISLTLVFSSQGRKHYAMQR